MENYTNNRLRNSKVVDEINNDIKRKNGEVTKGDVEGYKIGLMMEISRSLAAIADAIQ